MQDLHLNAIESQVESLIEEYANNDQRVVDLSIISRYASFIDLQDDEELSVERMSIILDAIVLQAISDVDPDCDAEWASCEYDELICHVIDNVSSLHDALEAFFNALIEEGDCLENY